jgi:hypothetical protein
MVASPVIITSYNACLFCRERGIITQHRECKLHSLRSAKETAEDVTAVSL